VTCEVQLAATHGRWSLTLDTLRAFLLSIMALSSGAVEALSSLISSRLQLPKSHNPTGTSAPLKELGPVTTQYRRSPIKRQRTPWSGVNLGVRSALYFRATAGLAALCYFGFI